MNLLCLGTKCNPGTSYRPGFRSHPRVAVAFGDDHAKAEIMFEVVHFVANYSALSGLANADQTHCLGWRGTKICVRVGMVGGA
jgi:hypothetical protein